MPLIGQVSQVGKAQRKSLEQCDQMARLLAQYLAIYNNAHLPNTIKNSPK